MTNIELSEILKAIGTLGTLYIPLVVGYDYCSRNYYKFFYGIGGLEGEIGEDDIQET